MRLSEIFSSIQGEGIYVGYRQIFLRFSGCNMDCDYCDENAGEGQFYDIPEVLERVRELGKNYHHSVSLTGGEPLLQINDMLKLLPEIDLPKYLETNATLPAHLKEIRAMIDIFSMDFKPGFEKEFQESLELVREDDAFVKFIQISGTFINDLRKAVDIVSLVNKDIPFIIQPVTPHKLIKHMPTGDEIIAAYQIAKRKLSDVRVIPQTHKILRLK
ncbi:MAG: 7-carboxy-7-deazaguanine synthase QueE [Candidatus Margulisiibacteriota bacterium]